MRRNRSLTVAARIVVIILRHYSSEGTVMLVISTGPTEANGA